MNRFKELLVLPSTLVSRLLLGHVAPVLVVTLALGMTLASLLRMTSVLEAISAMELSALHRESALHHACWSVDVTLRRHERACHAGATNLAARDDVQERMIVLRQTVEGTPGTGPGMQEVADGWIQVAHEVLAENDICAALHEPARQRRRAQLDERMTDLWADRLNELHAGLEVKEVQARRIGLRALTTGMMLALASLVLALFLARRMARSVNVPLARLAATTRLVGRGDFTTTVSVDGPAEIVALADDIRSMQSQLAELDALKQGFLASVSHELRTPLSKIREALALLGDGAVGELDTRQVRVVQIARAACEREIRMVTTLLDLSRLRTGSPLRFKDGVSVDAVIETALSEESADALSKGVTVSFVTASESPVCRLDPVLLERAIANLVRNAVAVSPARSRVEVRREVLERPGQPGDWIRVTVSDEGPGVPAEIRATVFNAFVTGAVPNSPKAVGVGLGLALAREIARAHGGELLLDEEKSPGATFRLWIPQKPATPKVPTERPPRLIQTDPLPP